MSNYDSEMKRIRGISFKKIRDVSISRHRNLSENEKEGSFLPLVVMFFPTYK
jgi:hypothetical protein